MAAYAQAAEEVRAAVWDADMASLRELVYDSATANLFEDEEDHTTLLWLASQNGSVDVGQHLIGCGADLNYPVLDGFTPLFVAAQFGHTEVVRALVDAQADMEHTSQTNATALYIAVQEGHIHVVEILLNANARRDTITEAGITAEALLHTEMDVHRQSGDEEKFALYTEMQQLFNGAPPQQMALQNGATAALSPVATPTDAPAAVAAEDPASEPAADALTQDVPPAAPVIIPAVAAHGQVQDVDEDTDETEDEGQPRLTLEYDAAGEPPSSDEEDAAPVVDTAADVEVKVTQSVIETIFEKIDRNHDGPSILFAGLACSHRNNICAQATQMSPRIDNFSTGRPRDTCRADQGAPQRHCAAALAAASSADP